MSPGQNPYMQLNGADSNQLFPQGQQQAPPPALPGQQPPPGAAAPPPPPPEPLSQAEVLNLQRYQQGDAWLDTEKQNLSGAAYAEQKQTMQSLMAPLKQRQEAAQTAATAKADAQAAQAATKQEALRESIRGMNTTNRAKMFPQTVATDVDPATGKATRFVQQPDGKWEPIETAEDKERAKAMWQGSTRALPEIPMSQGEAPSTLAAGPPQGEQPEQIPTPPGMATTPEESQRTGQPQDLQSFAQQQVNPATFRQTIISGPNQREYVGGRQVSGPPEGPPKPAPGEPPIGEFRRRAEQAIPPITPTGDIHVDNHNRMIRQQEVAALVSHQMQNHWNQQEHEKNRAEAGRHEQAKIAEAQRAEKAKQAQENTKLEREHELKKIELAHKEIGNIEDRARKFYDTKQAKWEGDILNKEAMEAGKYPEDINPENREKMITKTVNEAVQRRQGAFALLGLGGVGSTPKPVTRDKKLDQVADAIAAQEKPRDVNTPPADEAPAAPRDVNTPPAQVPVAPPPIQLGTRAQQQEQLRQQRSGVLPVDLGPPVTKEDKLLATRPQNVTVYQELAQRLDRAATKASQSAISPKGDVESFMHAAKIRNAADTYRKYGHEGIDWLREHFQEPKEPWHKSWHDLLKEYEEGVSLAKRYRVE